MPDYQHAEAYCLMTYRADDGTETEQIWNSRDGVTPYVITLRSGKCATHTNWGNDQRIPDYQPPPGSRMFVDLTPERARELAAANVARILDDPSLSEDLRQEYGDREKAIAELAASYLEMDGAPDLVEVTAPCACAELHNAPEPTCPGHGNQFEPDDTEGLREQIERRVREDVRLRLGPRAREQIKDAPILLSGTEAEAISRSAMTVVSPVLERQRAELAEMRRASHQEIERQMLALIDERDRLETLLDTFTQAVAPTGVIGEHSSANDPWANALGLVTSAAEVEQLRSERDALQDAIDAAMREHQVHAKVFHPDKLLDPRCPWCRIGLVLSRERPARPDSREEVDWANRATAAEAAIERARALCVGFTHTTTDGAAEVTVADVGRALLAALAGPTTAPPYAGHIGHRVDVITADGDRTRGYLVRVDHDIHLDVAEGRQRIPLDQVRHVARAEASLPALSEGLATEDNEEDTSG